MNTWHPLVQMSGTGYVPMSKLGEFLATNAMIQRYSPRRVSGRVKGDDSTRSNSSLSETFSKEHV